LKPIVIGLTGGIACGKSTIARILKRLGAIIIDADTVSKGVVATGSPAWQRLIDIFGRDILNPDKSINRRLLGNRVFGNPERLATLNSIVHPEVTRRITEKINKYRQSRRWPVIVLDAPLLFEAGADKLVDVVWVVAVDQDTQISRLMNRDRMEREQAERRISSQMPLAEKIARADAVINNRGTRRETKDQILHLWVHLKQGNETETQ
jgi:dephospho-CoA kinase